MTQAVFLHWITPPSGCTSALTSHVHFLSLSRLNPVWFVLRCGRPDDGRMWDVWGTVVHRIYFGKDQDKGAAAKTRAFVYWKLRQFVRHQTAAISHALRRHFPLAPLWRLSARARQFSNNFRVEDAKIVSNIRRDCSLAATENLFALIIQSYVFEQSMIYLKIISFNIANY